MKKIGIFGGTFNPPHIAHSIVAESVRQQLKLDIIIFIPSGNPPLKQSIPSEYRMEMSKLAFGNDKNFNVSNIETQNINKKSFTVDTLIKLHKIYDHEKVKFYLIIGIDNLIELPKWKEPDKLFELAEVIVINRPNYSPEDSISKYLRKVKFIDVPFIGISSSMIREYVSKKRSIKYLVCNGVEEYIIKHKLYL